MSNGYYFSSLLVTDVVSQTSLLLLSALRNSRTDRYPELEPGVYELHGVVSRKTVASLSTHSRKRVSAS